MPYKLKIERFNPSPGISFVRGVSSQFFVVEDCSVKEAPHFRKQEQSVG